MKAGPSGNSESADSFAGGAVYENRILFRLPDGDEFHTTWAVKAVVHPARFPLSDNYPLGHLKRLRFELMKLTDGKFDEVP